MCLSGWRLVAPEWMEACCSCVGRLELLAVCLSGWRLVAPVLADWSYRLCV